jgi:DNA-binding transcriptional MocR family regulator
MKNAHDIFRMLESQIRLGKLAPGEKLPPVRDLATSLRVDKNTVLAAYGRLREAGLTQSLGRGGTIVADSPGELASHERSLPEGMLDLTHGNPDAAFLPAGEDLQRILTPGFLNAAPHLYDGVQTHPDLAAWARAQFAQDGLPAEHIAVTGGAMDAIDRVLRLCLSKGDAVAVERPNFPAIPSLIRSLGHKLLEFDIDEHGPRPDSLAQAIAAGAQAIIVTPRAQNPSGACIPAQRARELARLPGLAASSPLWIEDDHFNLLSAASYEPGLAMARSRWIVVRSVSKFLGPDFRLALCAGDAKTIAGLQANQWLSQRWQSHFLQRLVTGLLRDEAMQAKIERAGAAYRTRRRLLTEALAPLGLRVPPGEGLNLWLPVDGGDALVAWLLGRGIAVRGSRDFFGAEGTGIRLTISALDETGIGLLCAALKDWRGVAMDAAQA